MSKKYFKWELDDPTSIDFWKVFGEADAFQGSIEFPITKDLLKKDRLIPGELTSEFTKIPSNAQAMLFNMLDKSLKDIIIKIWPNKCPYCGFHRFFIVRVKFTSLADFPSLVCPSCYKVIARPSVDDLNI